jgi:PAS domain S-box-containing protein
MSAAAEPGVTSDLLECIQKCALLESDGVFRKILDCQSDAIFILDGETPPKIVDCNCAAIEMLGYQPAELVGRSMEFLYLSESADCPASGATRSPGLPANQYERYKMRKDGSVFPIEQGISMLDIAEGQPAGWVAVVSDSTERSRFEQKLCNRTYELERRLNELNCLYGLSQISESPGKSTDEVFTGAMKSLAAT